MRTVTTTNPALPLGCGFLPAPESESPWINRNN